MIIEKILLVSGTTLLGGLVATAVQPDNISTTFVGICATVLLWVIKELNGLSSRISKLEQKMDDKLDDLR